MKGAHLYFVTPALPLFLQSFRQRLTNQLYDLVLIFKSNFLLRWVNVDVDLARMNREGEVNEGMTTFCEECTIEPFEGPLER